MIGLEKYLYRRVAAKAPAPLLLILLLVACAASAKAQTAPAAPPYIVQSQVTLSSTLDGASGNYAVNSRGDFFILDGGSQYFNSGTVQHLLEYPVNGGPPIVLFTDGNANGPNGVAVDPFDNVFITENQGPAGNNDYDSGIYEFPYTNGTYPGPYVYSASKGATNKAPGSCNVYQPAVPPSAANPTGTAAVLANTGVCTVGSFQGVAYYYWQPLNIAADGQGNIYFYSNYDNIYHSTAKGIFACDPQCVQQAVGGEGTQLTISQGAGAFNNSVLGIAADYAGDVFYVDGTTVSEYPYLVPGTTTPSPTTHATPIVFDSTYNTPYGVQVDHSGNLYVSDATGIWEVPSVETKGGAPCQGGADACTLVAKNKFKLVSLPGAPPFNYGGPCYTYNNYTSVAADTKGNLVYSYGCSSYHQNYLYKTSLWSGTFAATEIGSTAATPPTFSILFDSATTLAAIKVVQDSTPATEFALTPGTCTAGTAFAANSTCTFSVSFTPTGLGARSGAILVTDGTGKTTTTALSGVGTGTGITVDPGTPSQIGATFKGAAGLAVDAEGNVYVADSVANTVTEYPVGGGASVSIGTGLSVPTGVAVDGAGNVLIVNQGTGNTASSGTGSVVEVPNVAGVLTNSAQTTVATGLNTPTDIVVDPQGNYYVSETGTNQVVQYTSVIRGGETAAPVSIGFGLSGPTGLALDTAGNIYVADTGNNRVLQLGDDVQNVVGNGLTAPVGVVVDPSGSVIIADGSGRLVRVPNEQGKNGIGLNQADQQVLDSPLSYPYSVRLDSAGNLYVSDNVADVVYQLRRTAGTVNFGNWNLNTLSDPQTIVVSNFGTDSVTLGNPLFAPVPAATGFSVSEGSSSLACGGGLFPSGFACQLTATFDPAAAGPASYALTLAAPNTANPAPVVQLKGNGVNLAKATITVTQLLPVGTISYGQTTQFQATITPTGGTAPPTGAGEFVVFTFDGQDQRESPVVNGVATFTFPLVNAGSHSISAHYLGDAVYPELESAILPIVIVQATSTNTLIIIGDSADPLSSAPGSSMFMTDVLVPATQGLFQGTVMFINKATNPATVLATVPVSLQTAGVYAGKYTASFTFNGGTGLQLGTYDVDAVFSGNSNYSGDTSALIPFTIIAPTFTVTPDVTTVSSTASTPGVINLTILDYSNFQGGVDLSCTGLPANAYCIFRPDDAELLPAPNINPNTIYPVSIVLQFAVDQNPAVVQGSFGWVGAVVTLLLLFVWRRKVPTRKLLLTSLLAVLCLGGIASLSGCGSSSGTGFATLAGSYPIVVSATATPLTSGSEPGCVVGAPGCTSTTVNTTQTFNATLTVK